MSTEKSMMAETIEWHNIRMADVARAEAKAQREFAQALRKWALEFLAGLNPGKMFDGDVFEDADAIVAYITSGRPVMVQQPVTTMAGIDPFNVNTGLAQ